MLQSKEQLAGCGALINRTKRARIDWYQPAYLCFNFKARNTY